MATGSSSKRPRVTPSSTTGTQLAHPWPKLEGVPIKFRKTWSDPAAVQLLKNEVVNRPITEHWDDYDSLYYNEWLKVTLAPTRIADYRMMRNLGIYDDVIHLMERVGLGTMATQHHIMYPDLVRQFFATVRVYYPRGSDKTAQQGTLTFMIRGLRYRVSFQELCEIYGFIPEMTGSALPAQFPAMRELWARLGTGLYETKHTTQMDVRHPAFRYLVRLFSTTLLCQRETGRMRLGELILLYYALWMDFEDAPSILTTVNLGAVFAHHLVELKTTPFSTSSSSRAFTAGSLLTPIFKFCGINTVVCRLESAPCTMDSAYLVRTTWLQKGQHWVFRPSPGVTRMVQLPIPGLPSVVGNAAAWSFEPDQRLLRVPVTRASRTAQPSQDAQTSQDAGPSRSRGTSRATRALQLSQMPEVPQIPMSTEVYQQWVAESFRSLSLDMHAIAHYVCPPSQSSPRAASDDDEDD